MSNPNTKYDQAVTLLASHIISCNIHCYANDCEEDGKPFDHKEFETYGVSLETAEAYLSTLANDVFERISQLQPLVVSDKTEEELRECLKQL